MVKKLIVNGKAWGEFEQSSIVTGQKNSGNIILSGYRTYGGVHTIRPVEGIELNENQLIVLETLQKNANQGLDSLIVGGIDYIQLSEISAIEETSQEELFKVLAVFAEWGMKRE